MSGAEEKSLERPIKAPAQLLVEGRTPEIFFREFVKWLKLEGQVEVRTFGDISRKTLETYLKVFSDHVAFKNGVRRLAIIRDAEAGPASEAYESVCGAVRSVLRITPAPIGQFSGGPLSVGIFILPDCSEPGMLESLCLDAVDRDESVLRCVSGFANCLGKEDDFSDPKRRLAAWVLAKGVMDPQLGRAAQKPGLIPWDAPAFDSLRSFLSALAAGVSP